MKNEKGKEKEVPITELKSKPTEPTIDVSFGGLLTTLNKLKQALTTYKPSSFLGFRDEEKSKSKAQAIQSFLVSIQDVDNENLNFKNINKVFNAFNLLYKTNQSLEKDEFGGNLGKIIQKFKPNIDGAKKEFDDMVGTYKTELLQKLDKLRIQLSLAQAISSKHDVTYFEYYQFRLAGEPVNHNVDAIRANLYELQKQLMKLDWDVNRDAILKESGERSSGNQKVTPQDILLERYKLTELNQSILIFEKEFLGPKSQEEIEIFEESENDASNAVTRYQMEQNYRPWLVKARKDNILSLIGSSDLQAATSLEGNNNFENAIAEMKEVINRANKDIENDPSKKDPFTGERRAGTLIIRAEEEWLNDLLGKTIIYLHIENLNPNDIKYLANEFPERLRNSKYIEFTDLHTAKQAEFAAMQNEAEKLVTEVEQDYKPSSSLK